MYNYYLIIIKFIFFIFFFFFFLIIHLFMSLWNFLIRNKIELFQVLTLLPTTTIVIVNYE